MLGLTRIELTGYRSIRELSLQLRPLNVLIGGNGAGKTNLLSLFRLLSALISADSEAYVEQQGGADALLYYGAERTPRMKVELEIETPKGPCTLRTLLTASEFDQLTPELPLDLHVDGENVALGLPLYMWMIEHLAKSKADHRAQAALWVTSMIRRWAVYRFHSTAADAPPRQPGTVEDHQALDPDGGNLAPMLYFLSCEHPSVYAQVRDTVRMVAPFFEDFSLEPSRSKQILLEWRDRSGAYLKASQLSDGTLSFICLATLLLAPTTAPVLLLDEPELGLHPYAISLLAALLKGAAARTQIIVATQSVTLLDQLDDPEDVIVVDRGEQESSFRRLDAAALALWLEEYSLGELWQKNVLGGKP